MGGNGKKKMNKRTTTLLVGLLVLVLLGSALVLLLWQGGKTEPPDAASSGTSSAEVKFLITDKSADDVKTLTITNASGTYTVAKNANVYTMQSYQTQTGETVPVPSDVVLTENELEFMTGSLFSATLTQTVEGGEENLALYGLDKPSVTAQLTYLDGSTATIEVGDVAPDGTSYYVYNPATKEVGLTDKTGIYRVENSKEDFVNKTLVPTQQEQTDTIKKIELSGSIRPEPIVLQEIAANDGQDDSEMSAMVASGYTMTSPKVRSDTDSARTAVLSTEQFGLTATGVAYLAPTPEQLAETGLAEPYSAMSLTFGGKTVQVKLGAKNEQGQYYCTTSENSAIFVIDADLVKWADYSAYDLYYKLVCVPNIKDVAAFTLELDAKTYRFELTHDENDELTVVCDGKTLDTEAFRGFYQLAISAKGEYEADAAPEGVAPQMRFTYEYTDKSKANSVVEFIAQNDRRSVIVANGETDFSIRNIYVQKVRDSIEPLFNGIKIAVTW